MAGTAAVTVRARRSAEAEAFASLPGESERDKASDRLAPKALRALSRVIVVLALAVCLAWPWIDQRSFWMGWLGLGGFMCFQRYVLGRAAPLWTLFYSATALAVAFHWTPDAMAYTMDASLLLGGLVVVPILFVEGVRLAVPFVLVGAAGCSRHRGHTWDQGTGRYAFGNRPTRLCAPLWLWLAMIAVALETMVPTVFPWRLGHMQAGVPLLNQLVPVFGPSISTLSAFAMAAVVCGAFATAVCRVLPTSSVRFGAGFEKREVWTAAVFTGINLTWGLWSMAVWERYAERFPGLKVALVQVDPSYTDSLDKMRALSRQVDEDVELICWPESSLGCYAVGLKDFTDRKVLLKNSRPPLQGVRPLEAPQCELLAGGKAYEGPRDEAGGVRVCAYLVDRQERIIDRYDKTRLMPFGEYVPGAETIPALTRLFGFGADPPTPGMRPRVLTASCGTRLGVMMCYEDMLPDIAQTLVRDGAEVLIALINGTAFESPIALLQHRQLASFRALESRRFLLRTASTGSTCVIDPLGRTVAALPAQTEGVLQAEVALLQGRTLFNRTGNVFGWTCVAAAAGFLLYGLSRRWRSEPQRLSAPLCR